ncbi:bifunctional diaminohydroxyphosphoribosylaminopyrimidine deaminase/5-amino-6-(5-phosphoribosylamino)uracil reductase RibD [Terriglobus sp.]|uniref:bifunctional diaminohydroxyphosphoribosylaminopyrimidine deaminase/5-amino-6-(5-phosphoribosylamino)uracil reductase RibD n=1 Tax=Terriglobus sp. TaxID=1889013 RepID=UPI003B00B904
MPFSATDTAHMQRALELAKATLGLASPNPQVGCVLAHDNVLVGEGAHRYDLRDHAEVVALKQAGEQARGATAYVTLEPCSHFGRTGPCANALIEAGVARVIAATLDPNPLVAGQGMSRIANAGIIAEDGLLQTEARVMNDAYARHILTGMPLVTLKSALSVDGRLAPLPVQRAANAPFWLTGTAAREEVHRFRHANDAILTGVGTVLADDPILSDRSNLQRRRRLMRVVLDTQCRMPLNSRLVESANDDLLIFCAPTAAFDRQRALRARGVRVEPMPLLTPEERASSTTPASPQRAQGRKPELDLRAILKRLGEMDMLSVLLEAGPGLNASLLNAGLVDKVVLFFAEVELGAGSIPFADDANNPFALIEQLQNIDRCDFVHDATGGARGMDACVRGTLHDPWAENFTLTPLPVA